MYMPPTIQHPGLTDFSAADYLDVYLPELYEL